MKPLCFQIITLLSVLCYDYLFAQKDDYSKYYYLRKNYEWFPENDVRAIPFIKRYIAEAKKDKNYPKLFQGYSDGVEFSADRAQKVRFADSTIIAAKLSCDSTLISAAYLEKGVIYYFHYKKYQLALNEFLIAFRYAENSKDLYYQNRLNYLIGVVKSYIGYYDEALKLFMKTENYFSKQIAKNPHPSIMYDSRRGYFNSLHQMVVCYRNMDKFHLADSITAVGLTEIGANREFRQESGYFLKERGISQLRKRDFVGTYASLTASDEALLKINDFAWLAVNYYYLGKAHKNLGQNKQALRNFKKVDSIFKRHTFIVPEARNTYEILIDYYKEQNTIEDELYYTKQLLKVDSILFRDFAYLSRRIAKEYDTKLLKQNQKRLERKSVINKFALWILGTITISFATGMFLYKRREQRIISKYRVLEQHLQGKVKSNASKEKKETTRSEIDNRIIEEVLNRLKDFEDKEGYKEHGLTLHKLAAKFNTNHYYLSQVVNEYKGKNFTKYLIDLRINYVTSKLYSDSTYLKYTIETLADECGMASRNHFSRLFREVNGISPAEFIKQRMEDVESERHS